MVAIVSISHNNKMSFWKENYGNLEKRWKSYGLLFIPRCIFVEFCDYFEQNDCLQILIGCLLRSLGGRKRKQVTGDTCFWIIFTLKNDARTLNIRQTSSLQSFYDQCFRVKRPGKRGKQKQHWRFFNLCYKQRKSVGSYALQ